MGLLGLAIYQYSETKEEQFRTRTMAYLKSFSLPWFAILGAHKALEHDLGLFAAVMIGVIATTAGGVMIDLFSNVTPEVVMPSEYLVVAAVLASLTYGGLALWLPARVEFFPITLVSVLVSFTFRVVAVKEHWQSVVPHDARGAGPGIDAGAPPMLKKAS
jgi:uncharacterized membrane protein YeiH